jgi:hypothetical protein
VDFQENMPSQDAGRPLIAAVHSSRWALWAGVTGLIEHVANFGNSLVRGNSVRSILTGDNQRPVTGVRTDRRSSASSHAPRIHGLRQLPAAPRSRLDRGPQVLRHQHRKSLLPKRIHSAVTRSGR